jgi:hypothetical protein
MPPKKKAAATKTTTVKSTARNEEVNNAMEVESVRGGGAKRLLERANSDLSVGSFIYLALPLDVLSLVLDYLSIGEVLIFAMTSQVCRGRDCLFTLFQFSHLFLLVLWLCITL